MITIEKKKEIVAHICSSKTFSNAPTSIALLQYLFDATLKNTDLKESVIEIEFFGKSLTKKDNPKVRVNVYNLRKKLGQYYAGEGKDDKYRLNIDKGQYLVRFEKQTSKQLKFRREVWLPFLPAFVLLLVLIIIILPPRKPKIWKSFLQKDIETILYVGDAFGMIGSTITGNEGWTRDYTLNNLEDFYTLCEKQPELKDKLDPPPYTYTTQMGVNAAKNLQRLFSEYNKDFTIRYSSKASIDEITESNSIYAGPVKNDNPFIKFFNEANEHLIFKDSLLYISGHFNIKDTILKFPYQVSNEEFAVVAKIPGPNNTVQFLFFSNHDIGVSATFEMFSDMNKIKEFEEKYLSTSEYFTAIFSAKGLKRTETDLELVMVIPID